MIIALEQFDIILNMLHSINEEAVWMVIVLVPEPLQSLVL